MTGGPFSKTVHSSLKDNPIVPPHVTATRAALLKARNLTELSKSTPLQIVSIGDSNATPGNFMSALWERDSLARLIDQHLAWMRSNVTSVSSEVLGPQTQVIKTSTMGNGPTNSPADTPWHPQKKRWIGKMRTVLGPYGASWKSMGGICAFDDPANIGRWFGFIVDRTSTGEDWERNMDRVAIAFFGRGNPDQTIAISTNNAVRADGSTYTGSSYSGLYSSFNLSLIDISGIDLSGIPTTGWDEASSACSTIASNITAISPTASLTIDPGFGAGAAMPGYLSNWLSGMTSGKKWLVKISCPDGSTNLGSIIEYIVLNNSTITGGVSVWDMAYSGNALFQCEWRQYNNDGTPKSGWSGDPGDFVTDSFVRPSLASRLLMRGENTYGTVTNYSNKSAWASATHNAPGLHVAILSLLANDVANSLYSPTAIFNHCYNLIEQVVRVNTGALVIFNLMPCIESNTGDNYRDYFYDDGGHINVRALWNEFVQQLKRACAAFPANTVVLDYQSFYGDIPPTALKARIGHLGTYKREASDPTDPVHTKASTWQQPSAQDISNIFSTWAYQ